MGDGEPIGSGRSQGFTREIKIEWTSAAFSRKRGAIWGGRDSASLERR